MLNLGFFPTRETFRVIGLSNPQERKVYRIKGLKEGRVGNLGLKIFGWRIDE